MEFCPSCGTLLQIDPGTGSHRLRFYCPVCPYVCEIKNKIVRKARIVKKEVAPIFSDKEASDRGAKMEARCPKCEHNEANFVQIQIRRADEAATTYYKCCKCNHQWND